MQKSKHAHLPSTELAHNLRNDAVGRVSTVEAIHQCFAMCDTFGKTPEQLETMTDGFLSMLGDFPAKKVMLAFETHVKRSRNLPALADIIGLIKRNGKPELKDMDYRIILDKNPKERTMWDWQVLKDRDAEMNEGWGNDTPPPPPAQTVPESDRVAALKAKLDEAQRNAKQATDASAGLRKQIIALQAELQAKNDESLNTIAWLRDNGGSISQIADFIDHQRIAKEINSLSNGQPMPSLPTPTDNPTPTGENT